MKRRLACAGGLLAYAGVLAGLLYGYAGLTLPAGALPHAEAFIEIRPGETSDAIVQRLVDAGVVRSPRTLKLAIWWRDGERKIRAGEYRFHRPLSALEVVDRLLRGEVFLRRFTVPEGADAAAVSDVLVGQGLAGREALEAALHDPTPIRDLAPAAATLEGYLFPDTYHVAKGTPARALLGMMVERCRRELRDLGATPGSEAAPLAAPADLAGRVILASLVEAETAVPEERPRIAGVFLNRLRRGMKLECDPTTIYALKRAGRYSGRLLREDLAFDHPYNTYRYPGLPPGPIGNPGRGALEATWWPAVTDALFFVALEDGTGRHQFSRTLRQHNRAVARIRRARRAGGR